MNYTKLAKKEKKKDKGDKKINKSIKCNQPYYRQKKYAKVFQKHHSEIYRKKQIYIEKKYYHHSPTT